MSVPHRSCVGIVASFDLISLLSEDHFADQRMRSFHHRYIARQALGC